jgi:hypothetical protein
VIAPVAGNSRSPGGNVGIIRNMYAYAEARVLDDN